MEILQFIFRGFWTWLGSFLIICAIFGGIGNLFNFRIYTKKKEKKNESETV